MHLYCSLPIHSVITLWIHSCYFDHVMMKFMINNTSLQITVTHWTKISVNLGFCQDTLIGHFCYNEIYFNWKFVARCGTSYFTILADTQFFTMEKRFVTSFIFIPFLRNYFLMCNASSQIACQIAFLSPEV